MSVIRSEAALIAIAHRRRLVPIVSTLLASLIGATLPVIASVGVLPPAGFLTLLAWRLLRPELWFAWTALPLGLADDLLSGAPIGTAPVLWTACLLLLDEIDLRLIWRDYRQEWAVAAALLLLVLPAAALLSRLAGEPGRPLLVGPQLVTGIAVFPFFVRVVARLDRWRLGG